MKNTVIRRDLQIPTVKEEIHRYGSQYSARVNPNDLLVNLMKQPDNTDDGEDNCQIIFLLDS
jgi:hypothetical protein